jgi:hypothetical protein
MRCVCCGFKAVLTNRDIVSYNACCLVWLAGKN